MNIGERLRQTDADTYRKLMYIGKRQHNEKIELGDTPENLMKANSYKRIGRRIRQTKWG